MLGEKCVYFVAQLKSFYFSFSNVHFHLYHLESKFLSGQVVQLLVPGARDAAKHPTMPGTVPHSKNCSVPNSFKNRSIFICKVFPFCTLHQRTLQRAFSPSYLYSTEII